MATLNITNSFSNSSIANANEVNQNFIDVKTFAESAVVQVDGSVKAGTAAIADGAITVAKLAPGVQMSGPTGPQGPVGPAGPTGPTGPQGATGGFNGNSNNTIDLTSPNYVPSQEAISIKTFRYSGFNAITYRDHTDAERFSVTDQGNVRGTGTYTNLSDASTKENIIEANVAELASSIDLLIPKHFNYIGDTEKYLGFIAQDVQSVLPDAVANFDEFKLGLRTDAIIAALVAKCQDLESRLAKLESK